MSAAVLHYFDGRGRAEIIRLTMAASGISWTEKHIITADDMDNLRASGKLLFNQVPLLEYDGCNLVQSDAIVRCIAKENNLIGCCGGKSKNCCSGTTVDMLYCGTRDFLDMSFLSYFFKPCQEVIEGAKTKAIPKYLPVYEKVLEKSKSGYLVGDQLTIADIGLFEVLLWINELCPKEFEKFPAVHAFYKKIANEERFAKYLKGPQRPRVNDARYVKEVKQSLRWE
ncbi:hypothetical protein ACOME3_008462 [Neoechinorhynchus agilis]